MNTETSLDTEIINNSNNLELKFVALSVEKAIKIVAVDDIVYLESSGRYTTLYFNNNSNITVCKNLGHFEKLFGKNHFIRTHHSFLINIAYLTKIEVGEMGGLGRHRRGGRESRCCHGWRQGSILACSRVQWTSRGHGDHCRRQGGILACP